MLTNRFVLGQNLEDPRHPSTRGEREKRRSPRFSHERNLLILPDPDGRGSRMIAAMADFSTLGVGFVISEPLPEGSLFILRLSLPGRGMLPLQYKVVHCRTLANGLFHIGASFERIIERLEEQTSHLASPGSQRASRKSRPRKTAAKAAPAPQTPEPAQVAAPADGFPAEQARGFSSTIRIRGLSTTGEPRDLEIGGRGEDLWLSIPASNGKASEMLIEPARLRRAIDRIVAELRAAAAA